MQSGVLGVAVMDRPKALNALDHTMIRELLQVVETVESDAAIKGLWIESSAEKAFCAGGDVRDVTNNGQTGGLTDLTKSSDYLADEYLLDVLAFCSNRCLPGVMDTSWVVAWVCSKVPMFVV